MAAVQVQPTPRSHERVSFKVPKYKYKDPKRPSRKLYPKWDVGHEPIKYPKNAVRIRAKWTKHGRLLDQVRKLLEGRWITLRELSQRLGASDSSISSMIRALRHPLYGGYPVIRRYTGNTIHGRVWEYTIPSEW